LISRRRTVPLTKQQGLVPASSSSKAADPAGSAFFGVPSMFDNLEVRLRLSSAEVKSSTQPDGGEVLAKRKSAAVRQGSKEACSKAVT